MDRFVRLESFPEGIEFPPALRDQVRYDVATKRLLWRGFMSKSDFDRLWSLTDDWGFRRALEDLFRISTIDDELPPDSLWQVIRQRIWSKLPWSRSTGNSA